jgi:glycosyltransferase involved in cell wall biosynthesis
VAPRRKRIREELAVTADSVVVSIIGRLVREKGYFDLVEAFARVARRFPRACLIAVCSVLESAHDDISEDVKRLISHLGLTDRVRLLPPESPVEEVLAASDVYVLPSHREGLPRSILEAMAMGLPVVATKIRGSREVVRDGVTGTLVEVGDVAALASAIERLLDDPGLRAMYGDQAKAIAQAEFDESAVIERQRRVLLQLRAEKGI